MSNRPLPLEPKPLPPFRIGDDNGELPQIARPHQGMLITGPLHQFTEEGFSFSFQTPASVDTGRHSGDKGSCIVYLNKSSPYCSDTLDPLAGPRFCRALVYTNPTQPRGSREQYEYRAWPLRLVREVTQGVPSADRPNILTRNQVEFMIERISGDHSTREYLNLNPVAQADEQYLAQLPHHLLKELYALLKIGRIPAHLRPSRSQRRANQR
ncbi:MAG: hypothetical protein AABX12_00850 [Nanoarchaeota archaeon]